MNNKYMAIYYDGIATSFTPTATIEAAHAHLRNLLSARRGVTNHTVSIIELGDDRILYYKNTHKALSNLANLTFSINKTWQVIVHSIHQALNELTPSFINR